MCLGFNLACFNPMRSLGFSFPGEFLVFPRCWDFPCSLVEHCLAKSPVLSRSLPLKAEILRFTRYQDLQGNRGPCAVGTECLYFRQNRYSKYSRATTGVSLCNSERNRFMFFPETDFRTRKRRAQVARAGALWTVRFSWMGCLASGEKYSETEM
jgi:hypothetical protein